MDMLGGLTPSEFLRDYWQKKPLVIRQAFPDFQCPVSADELAGLACEEYSSSRPRATAGGRLEAIAIIPLPAWRALRCAF